MEFKFKFLFFLLLLFKFIVFYVVYLPISLLPCPFKVLDVFSNVFYVLDLNYNLFPSMVRLYPLKPFEKVKPFSRLIL